MSQAAGSSGPTVAVGASFTHFPIGRPLRFWLNEVLELDARVVLADAGQVVQTLVDPRGVFAENPGGLNVVLLRWEDWGLAGDSAETLRLLGSALATSAAASRASHLVCVCPPSPGVLAAPALAARMRELDDRLAAAAAPLPGVDVVSGTELVRLYPVADHGDPQGDRLAQIPYRLSLFVVLAAVIARRLQAISTPPYKAIVVDCDGTLWGGVCAEDGPAGVTVDGPRRALQDVLVGRHDAGMLLALVSKNAEADVAAVFAERPEMPLRWEHFAARRIDWEPKFGNIRRIADELGIGTDSIVYLDDDAVECAQVRAELPEVLTLELPRDPARLPAFLGGVWAFDRRPPTEADRLRATHHRQQRERAELRAATTTLAEFLAAIELEVQIRPLAAGDLERAAQLGQRVTQFNLSGVRRTAAELGALWRSGALEAQVVEVRDRFGDYGPVGLLLGAPGPDRLTVDSFLLSCRALGRGVEHRMLAYLGHLAQQRGLAWVDLPLVETARNRPIRDFLAASVGAHRLPTGGPGYRVPARVAAGVRIGAETGAPLPAGQAPPGPGTAGPGPLRPADPRSRQQARIAAELAEPAEILARFTEWERTLAPRRTGEHVAPRGDVERRLAAIWADVLGLERVGVRDVFFELDGDSLRMVQIVARALDAFGVELPLAAFFESPTIEAHARRIAALQAGEP